MISSERLLRAYVRSLIAEGAFRRDEESYEKKTKKRGLVGRIKSFFTGAAISDKVAENWIEKKEDYFNIDLEDIEKDLTDKIFDFAEEILPDAKKRSRGKIEKVPPYIVQQLNKKFRPYFVKLEKEKRIQDREDRESSYDYDDYY